MISAKMTVANLDPFQCTVKCVLWNGSGAVSDEQQSLDLGLVIPPPQLQSVMALTAPLTLASPVTVTLQCVVDTNGPGVVGLNWKKRN